MSRLLLSLGLVAMEVCWLIPWAVLVGLWTDPANPRPPLSPLSIAALVLLGALATHGLGRRAASSRGARICLVGSGLVAVLLAVRLDQYPASAGLTWLPALITALAVMLGHLSPPALALCLGLFLWWRGIRLGIQTASYSEVENAFRWGIGALLAFALIMALSTRPALLPALEAESTPFVVSFFFFGLLTLALGRLESMRTRSRPLAINSQWLGVLVVTAGLVVLLALVVGQLLSFDLLLVATRPLFDLLGQVLLLLLYVLVIPLAYVVELLIYLILSLVSVNPNRQPPQLIQPGQVDSALQRALSQQLPPDVLAVLKAVGSIVLFAVALWVIAHTAARWRASNPDADTTAEERESMWQAGRLRQVLLAWLRALFGRGSRTDEELLSQPAAPPLAQLTPNVSSVRELYRQLLGLGESVGVHRDPVTTPLEHLASLQRSLAPGDDVAQLTSAYVDVRYAEREVSTADVAALHDQLQGVHPRDNANT